MPLSDDTKSKLASIKRTAFNKAGGQDPSTIIDAILENDGSLDDIDILTDDTVGTTNGTVTAISGSGADADINNNFAELTEKVNEIINALDG